MRTYSSRILTLSPESDGEDEGDEVDDSDANEESAGATDTTSNKRDKAAAFEINSDIDIKSKALLDMLATEPMIASPGVSTMAPLQNTCRLHSVS